MSRFEAEPIATVIDSESVSASGGSASGEALVETHSEITIAVEGDGNSGNFDLEVQGKLPNSNSYSVYDDSNTAEDLSSDANNARLYTFDVAELERVKVVFTNNDASSTTVTVLVAGSQRV